MSGDMEKKNKGKNMGVWPTEWTNDSEYIQTISSVKKNPSKETMPNTEPSAKLIN